MSTRVTSANADYATNTKPTATNHQRRKPRIRSVIKSLLLEFTATTETTAGSLRTSSLYDRPGPPRQGDYPHAQGPQRLGLLRKSRRGSTSRVEERNLVPAEDRVGGDDGEGFEAGLCNQHPIEGVGMVIRQRSNRCAPSTARWSVLRVEPTENTGQLMERMNRRDADLGQFISARMLAAASVQQHSAHAGPQ